MDMPLQQNVIRAPEEMHMSSLVVHRDGEGLRKEVIFTLNCER